MLKSQRGYTASIRHVSDQIGDQGRQGRVIASQRVRIVNIQRLMVAMFFAAATDAFAMNPEGHDGGWMTDFPPAIALLEAIPEARPLPSRNCPVTSEMLAKNTYEQIPLPRHRCPREQSPAPSLAYPAAAR